MTPETTGIAALDELGRRFEALPERRPRRFRRWPALALGVLALAATPALAAVVFDGPPPVEEQLPQVAAAVDRDDPAGTGLALARKGFRVEWVLITDAPRGADTPTRSRRVAAPPARTEILSVLNAKGGNEVSADTRELQVEVAPIGLADPRGAPLGGRPGRPHGRGRAVEVGVRIARGARRLRDRRRRASPPPGRRGSR